ncbi:MAG TPA: prepilin-type N-terminal cleavage/methylation domain-containing protein [Patescibacteria group bacterium]|nr:prepilin-type N-terminal cleavage/methylation domain-containing protein [Patescibacteria group bacterium]
MFIRRLRSANSEPKQRGDTIVEVLISLAVISLVLGGAYATANTSLQITRSSQERSNATKLAESQIEQLKGLANTNPSALFSAPSPFCIYQQTTVVSASDSRCVQNTSGDTATAEPKFKLSIDHSGNDFTVHNSWFDPDGKVTSQLQIVYRVYQ